MVVVLVVSIVRKVAQSEWDCSLTKKRKRTSHCESRALFTRKAPTKNTLSNLVDWKTVYFLVWSDSVHIILERFWARLPFNTQKCQSIRGSNPQSRAYKPRFLTPRQTSQLFQLWQGTSRKTFKRPHLDTFCPPFPFFLEFLWDFFSYFFNVFKRSPIPFLKNIWQQVGCSKSPKVRPFTIFGIARLFRLIILRLRRGFLRGPARYNKFDVISEIAFNAEDVDIRNFWVKSEFLTSNSTQRRSRASQTLAKKVANFWTNPNKQYHTESQG